MGQSKAYKKLSELHYKSFVLLLVPAAGSPTATLLRLHSGRSPQSHIHPPKRLGYKLQLRSTSRV